MDFSDNIWYLPAKFIKGEIGGRLVWSETETTKTAGFILETKGYTGQNSTTYVDEVSPKNTCKDVITVLSRGERHPRAKFSRSLIIAG